MTLDTVVELGGSGGPGTNPEQLFAAGYAACFLSALKYVAAQKGAQASDAITVTATVGVGPRDEGHGFGLALALSVHIPGLDKAAAEALVAETDTVCPYSNLARHGTKVVLSVA